VSTPYYADEQITLWQGDSLALLLDMPDASVDAVITDPPYSSGGTYRSDRAGHSTADKYNVARRAAHLPDFGGDNRDQRSWSYWCVLWMTQALRVTAPGGILACSIDWRQLPALTDAIQAAGWTWRGVLVWAKPDARPQQGRPTNACEFIAWATAGHRPLVGESLPGLWVQPTPRDRHHQTEKPLQIYRDLVRVAPVGGIVLDPFAGSGTTGVAALAEGRRFVGIEMSAAYVDVALGRLKSAAGLAGHADVQPALDLRASA
jgi:site-specific DNA-methyltransferase (adenine-specific)